MLLGQLMHEPCFDTLRTKEQLGYLVHSSGRSSIAMTGIRINIQSERDAAYLEERIDAFLLTFDKHLSELSDAQFTREKESLANRLREDFKNLYQETGHYWIHIHSGYVDFERNAGDAERILALSKEDMLEYFRAFFHPASKTRAKVSVMLQSQHISKATAELVPLLLKEAGVSEVSKELTSLLEAEQTPLLSAVLEQVQKEQVDAGKVEEIIVKIKESHLPSKLGEGKKIFDNADELKKRMSVGPPSTPAPEYKELLSKL